MSVSDRFSVNVNKNAFIVVTTFLLLSTMTSTSHNYAIQDILDIVEFMTTL